VLEPQAEKSQDTPKKFGIVVDVFHLLLPLHHQPVYCLHTKHFIFKFPVSGMDASPVDCKAPMEYLRCISLVVPSGKVTLSPLLPGKPRRLAQNLEERHRAVLSLPSH
jgi:hypothetical protein